ncbi:MAG: hypothetical protein J6Q54_01245 [Oscillospiraceae bacterium]|nr:hypothetical protein [Oscillospiraceae bacterium]
MKANYTKPLLTVEMFSAAQSSARDCADSIPKDRVNLNDVATCAWDLGGGFSVFVVGAACTMDGENMGFACYNNPTEENYIFRS